MKKVSLKKWFIKKTDAENDKVIPVTVPGSMYEAYLNAGEIPDPFYRDNEDQLLTLMDKCYTYESVFEVTSDFLESTQLDLVFEGIDTLATIKLNDQVVGTSDNMHRTWRFNITDNIVSGENRLEVLFDSPTNYIAEKYSKDKLDGTEDCMKGFPYIRKAHCMFGWDWGPHLPDLGLFRYVYIEANDIAKIESVYIRQIHEADHVLLKFEIEAKLFDICSPHYNIKITDPTGINKTYYEYEDGIKIFEPKLWWPNGLGAQNLYEIEVIQKVADSINTDIYKTKVGLRTLNMHIEKDQWGESFAHQVNGIDFFAMGADYIPEDNLIGRVTYESTRKLLEQCRLANFNTIRVWGGGYYPNDWFFDICDELGLVVWQDFMFACAVYRLTDEFESNIVAEIIDNIKRIRNHASLGLWCGNNEMEMFVDQGVWVNKPLEKSDYVKMYEYIFPKLVAKYSPDTFYWPASPSSGGAFEDPNGQNKGDAHYWDVWHGNKPFAEYRKFHFRYLSEFGFQSLPSVKTIEAFTLPEDRNVFSYVMEKHQRNNAANGKIMNYLYQTFLYPTNLENIVYASQLLQAEAIKYGVEHYRRNRGRCMGTVYWQLNDCWPVTSWASIDYYGRWKALHYYAKRFFAPILLSCEEEGMLTQNMNINDADFNIQPSVRLNISNEQRYDQDVQIRWSIRKNDNTILQAGMKEIHVKAMSAVWLDKRTFNDIDIRDTYFSYSLYQGDNLISENSVIFSVPKFFKFLDPQLSFTLDEDEIIIQAKNYAKSVEILNDNEDLVLSDNYFDMNPGERRIKILAGSDKNISLKSVFDIK